MGGKIEVLFRSDGAALGVSGPLVIAVTDGPNAFALGNVRHVVDQIARLRRTTHQKQLVYLYVAGEKSDFPSAEARAVAAEISQHFDACIGVHEGAGFRASAVRAVVVGISMLSRARVRQDIVATASEAAALVRARYPEIGTEADVQAAIAAVRAAATSR